MPNIRPAVEADIPELISMGLSALQESSIPFTADTELASQVLLNGIHSDTHIHLVEDNGEILTGYITGVVERDFTVELFAYMMKMYVRRKFRGSGTARALLAAFNEEAENLGASMFFASSTYQYNEIEEKQFVNLFHKHGYETLGSVLMRRI